MDSKTKETRKSDQRRVEKRSTPTKLPNLETQISPRVTEETQLMSYEPDKEYLSKRDRAYHLETEVSTVEREYQRQIQEVIRKAQKKFYQKYGGKIQELDELQDDIRHEKVKGQRRMMKQLQQLYWSIGQEGGASESDVKRQANELVKLYRKKYLPNDNYQKKRDAEAKQLRQSLMGSLQQALGGGGMVMGYEGDDPMTSGLGQLTDY